MDHSLAPPLEFPAPNWRKLAIVLGAVALVETLVILIAAVVLVAKPMADDSKKKSDAVVPAAKTGPDAPVGKPTLTPARTVVMVLNGNGRPGAAAATAVDVRRLGYRTGAVTNASRMDYPQSVVMYRPGFRPEAVRFARRTHVTAVGPLDGISPKRLGRAHVVYIVGAS